MIVSRRTCPQASLTVNTSVCLISRPPGFLSSTKCFLTQARLCRFRTRSLSCPPQGEHALFWLGAERGACGRSARAGGVRSSAPTGVWVCVCVACTCILVAAAKSAKLRLSLELNCSRMIAWLVETDSDIYERADATAA